MSGAFARQPNFLTVINPSERRYEYLADVKINANSPSSMDDVRGRSFGMSDRFAHLDQLPWCSDPLSQTKQCRIARDAHVKATLRF